MTTPAEKKKHSGSCHCGKVKFEVKTDLASVLECNCSIRRRVGALRTFVPATDFQLLSGEDSLADYQFNKKWLHHLHCKSCGIHPFARGNSKDGTPTVAVNVRCLPDVDLSGLKITHFDGASR